MMRNLAAMNLVGLLFGALLLAGCNKDSTEPLTPSSQATQPNKEESLGLGRNQTSSDAVPAVPSSRQALFGDLHVHSGWSFDAFVYNVRATPDDAYRFGLGEAIGHVSGKKIKLQRPLDFMAVTDHAEYLGIMNEMLDSESPLSTLKLAEQLLSEDAKTAKSAYRLLGGSMATNNAIPELVDADITRTIWQRMIDAANRYNRPGEFTTFVGYEWTSTPAVPNSGQGRNLHRNVIFRNDKVSAQPFSSFDSQKPEELWQWMDLQRQQGIELLAIPHNANVSDGLMYPSKDSYGNPLSREYATTRMRNEPINEVVQIKGQSMSHPLLSANDELANFEIFSPLLGSPSDEEPILYSEPQGSYVRKAYRDGLKYQQELGLNPFAFGVVGASDTHNGGMPVEEDNYFGKLGIADHTAQTRLADNRMAKEFAQKFSAAGLAGVWAETNTRESIYDALARKEAFATSGPRINVRIFGGWQFNDTEMENSQWVSKGYASGVPMGGELASLPRQQGAPRFLVWALKDPEGANLDRVQIVKGWYRDGESYEKVFDVALSDSRRIGNDGSVPLVGNTVDINSARYTNTIGDNELNTVWQDPEFDPEVPAFYYLRVLEIPTPRWSTYDAAELKQPVSENLPATIQERAWSSPIWYTPSASSDT